MNWFSEREKISLSTIRHRPHFDSWDQIQSRNSKYDGQYKRDIISSTAWEKEFIFNQGF